MKSLHLMFAAMACMAVCTPLVFASPPFTTPKGSAPYAPQEMETAYGFSTLYTRSTHQYDGTGQTIAIIDASKDTTISSDVNSFVSYYNSNYSSSYQLPAINLAVLNQSGTTDLSGIPQASLSQIQETSLDVEYAHAIAPKANIVLVEANSLSFADLNAATVMAANRTGVSVISMSYGSPEFSGENTLDSTYTQPGSGHVGVTYVASSGDNAYVSYPAASPHVLSVGGTSLTLNANGTYASESAWTGSGGGVSTQETEPTYQLGVQKTGFRTIPDVSYDADPNTGVSVFATDPSSNTLYAYGIGGTSAGAPQWAGLIALANEGRVQNGLGTLTSDEALSMLYAVVGTPLYAQLFHDVTSGSNSDGVTAGTGYDEVTGLGTPIAYNVVDYLAGNILLPEPTDAVLLLTAIACLFRRRSASRRDAAQSRI